MFEVAKADDGLGFGSGTREGRQKESGQNRNNAYDDQKLNQNACLAPPKRGICFADRRRFRFIDDLMSKISTIHTTGEWFIYL